MSKKFWPGRDHGMDLHDLHSQGACGQLGSDRPDNAAPLPPTSEGNPPHFEVGWWPYLVIVPATIIGFALVVLLFIIALLYAAVYAGIVILWVPFGGQS